MSKITLPWKELNGNLSMTFQKKDIEALLKWYLEAIHGKSVKEIQVRYSDANNYSMTVTMQEVSKPIAEVVDNKPTQPAAPATEVDLTI